MIDNQELLWLNALANANGAGGAVSPGGFPNGNTPPNNNLYQRWGTGNPEGVLDAPFGTVFTRTDRNFLASTFVKTTPSGTTTGWAFR